MTNDMERPASFYLGRVADPGTGELGEPLHYRASHLTTHAVCLGMTGSGKTGLCIDLLEEAALDGIPSIVIDPKGDITNLLLTFPELRPADFLPWVSMDEGSRDGVSNGMPLEAYAERVAQRWAEGVAEWGLKPERIQCLKESADFTIFTPGSDAGLPVNLMPTFSTPDLSWEEHEEELREKIAGTVTALLSLANMNVDSIHRREHVLLSNIVETAWRAGKDLDLPQLILQIQSPPMRRLGVFDIDTYFPPSDRMALAMRLNTIIAAPSFGTWLKGMPLDVSQIVRAPDGRPRLAIFYIAHLSESERMFFVTLLLQQVQAWMQTLSGTTALRAILYFDEVFGYFPPHPADPPSKRPLLTLLKQARAFGLGVVLVTQNPVDLDYKGLTNAGTWFIGKLQTDRDKMRVLEGLEGVASSVGTAFDRAYFDRLIGSLRSRRFIMHNVHKDRPTVFHTRWTMSYLRGPLTRDQVRELMHGRKTKPLGAPATADQTDLSGRAQHPGTTETPDRAVDAAPVLPPNVPQYYLPVTISLTQALRLTGVSSARGILVYRPAALGQATIRYVHKVSDTDIQQDMACLLRAEQMEPFADWEAAAPIQIEPHALGTRPFGPARFETIPTALGEAAPLRALERDFVDCLYLTRSLVISYNPSLDVYAHIEDHERDFRARCQEVAREKREGEILKVWTRYHSRIDRLEERIAREEQELEEDRIDQAGRTREELLSAGESVLSWLTGRKNTRAVSMASRKRRLTRQAEADVAESIEALGRLRLELDTVHREMDQALTEVNERWAAKVEDIQELRIAPTRSNIVVKAFGLVWLPHWELETGDEQGGISRQMIAAHAPIQGAAYAP